MNGAVGFQNVAFTHNLSHSTAAPMSAFQLRIPGQLLFKRNSLNIISGPTGSGKTSVLLGLLGELHCVPATDNEESWVSLPRDGGVAYAAQTPWIMSRSIKVSFFDLLELEEFLMNRNVRRIISFLEKCMMRRDTKQVNSQSL